MSIGLKGLVGAGFVLISAPMLLIMLASLGKIVWFSATGEVATAQVTTSDIRSGRRGSRSVPVARFVDEAGQTRFVAGEIGRGKSLSGRERLTHAVGTTVRVAYPAGRPGKAVFADGKTIAWMAFSVLFLAMFPVVGILLLRSDRRELREQGMID